jgi:hypothetical protein
MGIIFFSRISAIKKVQPILCLGILALLCWITLQYASDADFIGYWSAGRIFLDGGNPYGQAELQEVQRSAGRIAPTLEFWNPPWAFWLFLPFSLLNLWTARVVWICLEAILLLKTVHWLWIFLGGPKSDWCIACLALALYVPTIQTLLFAQITPFVLVGLAGFIWALERKNDLLAGLFSILIAAKPHIAYAFWILFLCFCIRNRKLKLFTSVAVFLVTSILILFLYNPNILLGIAGVILEHRQFKWITATPGFSLRMALGLEHVWLQALPTVLGALYVIFFWRYGPLFSWKDSLSPILLLSAATAVYLWPHDCIILLPAIIQILVWIRAAPHTFWWLLALLAVVDILIPLVPPWRLLYLAWWCPPSIALIYFIGFKYSLRTKP